MVALVSTTQVSRLLLRLVISIDGAKTIAKSIQSIRLPRLKTPGGNRLKSKANMKQRRKIETLEARLLFLLALDQGNVHCQVSALQK